MFTKLGTVHRRRRATTSTGRPTTPTSPEASSGDTWRTTSGHCTTAGHIETLTLGWRTIRCEIVTSIHRPQFSINDLSVTEFGMILSQFVKQSIFLTSSSGLAFR
eukprot:207517_1